MATNALAPKAQNALVRDRDPMQQLLKESAQSPQYGALIDYLSARRMTPPIVQTSLPSGATGEFTYPGWSPDVPKTGRVDLSYGAGPNTVVHELTHAADRQMSMQYDELRKKSKKQELTPEEQQFMSGYEKLVYTPGEMFGRKPMVTRTETAQRIAPEWASKKKDYRSTSGELAGFGMGSTVSRNMSPAPLHVDPTYATEFSILMDLARRIQPVIPGR